jgi:hypothetical protein
MVGIVLFFLLSLRATVATRKFHYEYPKRRRSISRFPATYEEEILRYRHRKTVSGVAIFASLIIAN